MQDRGDDRNPMPLRQPGHPAFFDETPELAWHPYVTQLFEYWRKRTDDGRRIPRRAEIDPVDLPRLLNGMWMLDVQHAPFRLRYRLVGTRIVDALGQDPTGRWVDEAHADAGSTPRFFERFRRVVETGVPSRRRGPAIFWFDKDRREMENIRLPLASGGETVDIVMVLTIFYRRDGIEFD
ncbi:MAG: PAS domain-containing protein [Proteobacteria bacterium]|nr:PAS domain-containing protein [Pseudomonadota bacterium]